MDQIDRYTGYALAREMMETPTIVRTFDPAQTDDVASAVAETGRLLLTGEGSSRIYPAKQAIRTALELGIDCVIHTEGARQAARYDLSRHAVFLASNSGRTSEVIGLARVLAERSNQHRYALTAHEGTVLESLCSATFVLSCGAEQAVAATKSVVEQALVYESLVRRIAGKPREVPADELADAFEAALTLSIDADIVRAATAAPTVYFAGFNDGVAEELTLKTNEITRRKADFLEGTYAVHGIEEVMDPDDLVVVVDPIPDDAEKFRDVLVRGVGLKVVAIADHETPFQTIRIPKLTEGSSYVQLAAGWNLLVEIGLALGVDLDHAERARKVGNEMEPPPAGGRGAARRVD